MLPRLQRDSQPVTVLLVNRPDTETTELLRTALTKYNLTLDQFVGSALANSYAEANIFPVDDLDTGTYTSLDGKQHEIVCRMVDDIKGCTIDGSTWGFRNLSTFKPGTGNIYKIQPTFLPF